VPRAAVRAERALFSDWLDVQADCYAFQALLRCRIALQNQWVVPWDDVLARTREPEERLVAFEHVAEIVEDRERALLLHVGIEMRCVGREDDPSAPGPDPHRLEPHGVAADEMHAQARGEFVDPVVELQAEAGLR
jgi:hypothetical protein